MSTNNFLVTNILFEIDGCHLLVVFSRENFNVYTHENLAMQLYSFFFSSYNQIEHD